MFYLLPPWHLGTLGWASDVDNNGDGGDDYGGDNDKEEEEEGETTKARGRGSPCNYGEYFMWSISKEI